MPRGAPSPDAALSCPDRCLTRSPASRNPAPPDLPGPPLPPPPMHHATLQEIPASDLRRLMTESFAGFAVPGTVKMAKVEVGGDGPTRSGPVSILELWHGPTCAFKDLGLQVRPQTDYS